MALSYWDEEEDEEEFDTTGDQFNKDMDALRRACQLTGEDQVGVENLSGEELGDDDDDDDDGQYLQCIQQKLMLASSEFQMPQKSQVAVKPEEADVEEDDADILRAIRNRFTGITPSFYGSLDNENKGNYPTEQFEDFSRTAISHKDVLFPEEAGSRVLQQTSQEECADSKAIVLHSEIFDDRIAEMSLNGSIDGKIVEMPLNDSIDVIGSKSSNVVGVPFKYAGIPGYARALIEALKKNRLCQKVMRSKLIQIETKLEENKDLMKRVKCLVDFQASCKRRLTQLLAQDSDPSVKLITCSKARVYSKKVADNRIVHKFCGPPENPDAAKYRMVQKNFPTTVEGNKWSNKERVDLGNGVKQQVQQTLVRQAMEILNSQENLEDASFLDEQISAIAQKEITAEEIRSFLPEVDWQCLASMYVPGRSGADCEARWLNDVDPLINRGPWTKDEDKKLLIVVQHNGFHNWIHISNMLGTNRTPSQCLSRYQRSLNAHIMRKEWTPDEDEQLRGLVETFGENDWQIIAANMEGRTGAQCLNRWCKSINPDRKKVGRWKVEEDKRLKLAVMVYGPRTWKKIATLIPGRTEVQCRERWCNVLDPSLNLDAWTEEEDLKLEEAISLYGYCWAKVALFVPPRTDNQCRRRWKALHPEELAAAQKAGKIRKAALISNFVGRKKERPTIGPGDFVQEEEGGSNSEAMITSATEDGKKEPCGISKLKRRKAVIDSSGLLGKKRHRPQCVKDKNIESSVVKRKRTHRTVGQKEHIKPSVVKRKRTHRTVGQKEHVKPSVVRRKRTHHTVGQKERVKPSEAHEHLVSKRTRKSMKAPMVAEGHHSDQEHNRGNFQVHSDGRPTVTIGSSQVISRSTRENRIKRNRFKSIHRKRIVNAKLADRETVQFTASVIPEDESLQHPSTNISNDRFQSVLDTLGQTEDVSLVVTNQGGEAPSGCNVSDKRVKEQQPKSHCKDTSVNQEKNASGMLQLTRSIATDNVNSDGTFLARAAGAEASSSYLKSEKRVKGKRTKLVRNPRVINKEKDDHGTTRHVMVSVPEDESLELDTGIVTDYRSETVLKTQVENDDTPLIASAQCGEIPLDCTKSYQRINGKQIKSARKTMSLNQENHEHATAQLMMHATVEHVNLDGMSVLTAQGADVPGSCIKADKRVKMKHIKSIQKAMLVNQEKDDQANMQFVMPPVPNDKYCSTFSSDKFEMGLNTQGQMDGISSGGNGKDGEVLVGCIKSNKGSNGKDIKSVHKSSTAEPEKGNQKMKQLTMHTATVHNSLDGMPVVNAQDAIPPSCCVKPDNMVKMSRSKSVPKSVSINQKRDDKEKVQFITPAVHKGASLPLTPAVHEGKTNNVSFAFASMVEAIADCCRHDSHMNVAETLALPPEQEFDSFRVQDTDFQSCHATVESSIGKERLGFDLPDSSHVPSTDAGIGGKDNETVALATKTILSWPFYFGLQILGSKWEDTKDHCRSFEERLENTQEHRLDDQQTYGSISVGGTSNIERIENGQQRNLMLQLSNENGVLNKGKGCEALADTENALNENINEKVEGQARGIQPRRSRRASRMNINYKEMLKGNFDADLHRMCKNKGRGNS